LAALITDPIREERWSLCVFLWYSNCYRRTGQMPWQPICRSATARIRTGHSTPDISQDSCNTSDSHFEGSWFETLPRTCYPAL